MSFARGFCSETTFFSSSPEADTSWRNALTSFLGTAVLSNHVVGKLKPEGLAMYLDMSKPKKRLMAPNINASYVRTGTPIAAANSFRTSKKFALSLSSSTTDVSMRCDRIILFKNVPWLPASRIGMKNTMFWRIFSSTVFEGGRAWCK